MNGYETNMNAIQEAIATVRDYQARDPQTKFLDGHSLTGDEAWKACLQKVLTMLEQVSLKHAIAALEEASKKPTPSENKPNANG